MYCLSTARHKALSYIHNQTTFNVFFTSTSSLKETVSRQPLLFFLKNAVIYLREFSKKFETTLMVYSGAWGKLIREKNQKSEIS